jgi:hypothetical protein
MTTYADEYKNIIRDYSYGMSRNKECFDLEDLRAHLEEYPEIAYVAFPMSWYGYGTNFVMLANNEYLEKHHSDDIHDFNTELFLKRELFFSEDSNSVELQELFFYTQNEYALISEEIYSRMEYDAKMDFLFSEISFELELELDEIEELFQKLEIDYSEWVSIDNDGYTVYALKDDLTELFELLKEAI